MSLTSHFGPRGMIFFRMSKDVIAREKKYYKGTIGLVWELNPGPLTPEARIILLDQRASQN